MNNNDRNLRILYSSLCYALAQVECDYVNSKKRTSEIPNYASDASSSIISQLPNFTAKTLWDRTMVSADSYRQRAASFTEPHDAFDSSASSKNHNFHELNEVAPPDNLQGNINFLQEFIPPEPEIEHESDLPIGGYQTPNTSDGKGCDPCQDNVSPLVVAEDRELLIDYTEVEAADAAEHIIPSLALPHSRVYTPCPEVHNSAQAADSDSAQPRRAIGRISSSPPGHGPLDKVANKGGGHATKIHIRASYSKAGLEADKATLRKWFDRQSNIHVVQVAAANNNSIQLPIFNEAIYRQEDEDNSIYSFSLGPAVEDPVHDIQYAVESELPDINPVTYREAVEELSFSRHFGSARTEWASPTLKSAIIVSEVVRSYSSEETELVEPLEYEIVLREPIVRTRQHTKQLIKFDRANSIRTMDVEVVKGTVDVVQQRPEGEHPRGASAGETSGNESGELPQVEHIAELVLVITSFGGAKKHFFQSNLARHLLDCKGVVYYLVDANRDFSTARDLKDRTLYDQWSAEGVLKCEYNNNRKTVIHPQLIIDGVSVGDARAIQDLEDDGDLDYIIARMLCPSCLSEKGQDMEHCPHCYAQYRTLIPPEYKEGVDIQRFYQGMAYNEDETEE